MMKIFVGFLVGFNGLSYVLIYLGQRTGDSVSVTRERLLIQNLATVFHIGVIAGLLYSSSL